MQREDSLARARADFHDVRSGMRAVGANWVSKLLSTVGCAGRSL